MLNYADMTDDELMKKLSLVYERISLMSLTPMLQNQLFSMRDSIHLELQERMEKKSIKVKLDAEPAVRDFSENKKPDTPEKKSYSKPKSDMIGRMVRSNKPTNIKDT